MSPNDVIAPVVVVSAPKPANGGVLENASIRQLGDRLFISGTLADIGDDKADPRAGTTFWFPLDDVLMLNEFPTLEAARATYRAYRKSLKPKRWKWF
jgi:hypothetical protein